jgi:beta-glucosidase
MFHWDYPVALYRRGGWLNPDSPKWFAEYAQVLTDRYSDRVENWITLNEPQCFIDLGHRRGFHAPGIQLPFDQVLLAAHNALLAHGMAVAVLRAGAKKPAKVGFSPSSRVVMPYSDKDIELARRVTFEVRDFDLFLSDSWWCDAVFLGQYPESGLKLYEQFLPEIGADDMKIISADVDFHGLNIYNGSYVTQENGEIKFIDDPYEDFTAFGWPVVPKCIYWKPVFSYERYKKPILITENGMAGTDFVNDDGKVIDDHRITFVTRHLREIKRAIADGADIRGYFHWSLFDNFEWAEGYTKRFGMVHVDYHNGKRVIKESGHWYKNVIAENGAMI